MSRDDAAIAEAVRLRQPVRLNGVLYLPAPSSVPPSQQLGVERSFAGATYDAGNDYEQLASQLARVYRLMKDGSWWFLADLAAAVGASEAGVSARVRDLRKPVNGALTVERKRVGNRYCYRLVR